MKSIRLIAAIAALALAGFAVDDGHADVSAAQHAEVDHLLAFIRESTCEFVRNGRSYLSERAYSHVLRKYKYFRDEIATTEDFILYAATQSTLSGKPYQFDCSGKKSGAQEVLLVELARFRAATTTEPDLSDP